LEGSRQISGNVCGMCDGSKRLVSGLGFKECECASSCKGCGGKGEVIDHPTTEDRKYLLLLRCNKCDGTGKRLDNYSNLPRC